MELDYQQLKRDGERIFVESKVRNMYGQILDLEMVQAYFKTKDGTDEVGSEKASQNILDAMKRVRQLETDLKFLKDYLEYNANR